MLRRFVGFRCGVEGRLEAESVYASLLGCVSDLKVLCELKKRRHLAASVQENTGKLLKANN